MTDGKDTNYEAHTSVSPKIKRDDSAHLISIRTVLTNHGIDAMLSFNA